MHSSFDCHKLLAHLNDMILQVDKDGNVVYLNDAAAWRLGFYDQKPQQLLISTIVSSANQQEIDCSREPLWQKPICLRSIHGELMPVWVTSYTEVDHSLMLVCRDRQGSAEAATLQGAVDSPGQVIMASRQTRHIEHLELLYWVLTSDYDNVEDRLQAYLTTGIELLGLQAGVVSRIENGCCRIIASMTTSGELQKGDELDLCDTYCEAVARHKRTITHLHVGAVDAMRHHPAFKRLGFEAYVGVPIFVDKQFYGTLAFVSTKARVEEFDWYDIEVVEIMAHILGNTLGLASLHGTESQGQSDPVVGDVEQLLERFAFAAAHDLKSPLRRLNLYSEILDDNLQQGRFTVDKENQQEVLDSLMYIRQSARKMTHLVNAMLSFARSGKVQVESHVAIKDVVNDALEALELEIKQAKAKLKVDSRKMPSLDIDPALITLVFQNLIANALKYAESGTRPEILVQCTHQKGGYVFSVTDNGIGIDEAYQYKVFENFERLSSASAVEGSGLGLATCKKIIENHGGRIWLKSKGQGFGTTVYFTLSDKVQPDSDGESVTPAKRSLALWRKKPPRAA